MNIYNFKMSFRNLLKNKLVTSINIIGLAIGISISVLTFSYVQKEQSMDEFIPDIDNVYVLTTHDVPNVSARMVGYVQQNIPEISCITFAHFEWSPQVFVKHNQVDFKIEDLLVADSMFFQVFQLESVYGNPQKALSGKNKIVLTQSLSKKIFGNVNPVGKELMYNATNLQNELLEVGAVIKDLPHNSSWDFDAVLSIETNRKIGWYDNSMKNWGSQNYASFFRLTDKVSYSVAKEKLAHISLENIPEHYKERALFSLFPFNKAYTDMPDLDLVKHGNSLSLIIIQIIGFLILILACINYVNLVTAQKLKRIKNIGILKALGSKKTKIIELVLTESVLVLAITSIISVILIYFSLEGLNNLTESHFTFHDIFSQNNLLLFFLILLFTICITGLIPGYILSKYQTTLLLKNSISTDKQNYLRNILLVFQFTISIVLIASILFINKQNNLLNNLDPGFKKENIVYTTTNAELQKKISAFKNELKKIPGIKDITFSSGLLGYNQQNWGLNLVNKGTEKEVGVANFFVSKNFFKFFGINLIKGSQFNDHSNDLKDWILNETAFKKFNIDKLEDARFKMAKSNTGNIIAETKDFNFESLHVAIRPVGFMCSGDVDEVAYLKMTGTNGPIFNQSINSLEKLWNKLSPNFPLEIKFMNTSWGALYKKENQFQKILNFSTIISLILSCLGLISLTIFVLETRTKEIGIRKINGAKTPEIIKMLNKDFIKWVLIAFIIACPIAYYAMSKWLENFAYKTELSWWIFALAGIIAMGIALLTVSFQSYRAATRNPVESLRSE
ncbi:ABC transporter permease [Ancylomarina sp. 16SWW S1-10-2]|uniref:ABC transporter permease n=1 Tax=Ancylomarina sp. 16SWW S1-10-2 TaxID=2499681 RepID=UPI0012ADD600|nr:ABC transporter permease [Ancylomarina sp. 16SWW S1-10-2]MRT93854.1 ABC transporter permease [Ancylomarina sp. 16SWW S1-10-2]